jgi:hypothetical protein
MVLAGTLCFLRFDFDAMKWLPITRGDMNDAHIGHRIGSLVSGFFVSTM